MRKTLEKFSSRLPAATIRNLRAYAAVTGTKLEWVLNAAIVKGLTVIEAEDAARARAVLSTVDKSETSERGGAQGESSA